MNTNPPPPPFTFEQSGRSPRAIAVLLLIYAALLAGVIFLDAALWIVGIIAVLTLPAIWELVIDKRAGLQLDRTQMSWFSGRLEREVPLIQIDRVQFDTRLDLSVRVTVYLTSGQKLRLPQDAVPPVEALKAALAQRDVKTESHHFRLKAG